MNDLQIAKKIQGWWLDAKADCRTFIERWVQIEDRDVSGLAIPFKLWEKQVEAVNAFIDDRLIVVLKARQLGLTWLALSYAVWKMIFTPGFSVVALSQKETPDAKELVRRVVFILRHLPKWITIEKSQAPPLYPRPTWEATTLTVTISHAGAEPSTFLAMASAPGAGRSFTASLVILDEWAFQEYAKEIYSAAYPTINRPTGGQVIGLSTAKRGTLFEEICLKARAGLNNFILVFLPWFADPRRTKEWYEKTKQDLPNTYRAEYPCVAAGTLVSTDKGIIPIEDAADATRTETGAAKALLDKGERPTIRISTDTGRQLIVTPDHRVKTPAGFVPANLLKVGDALCLSQPILAEHAYSLVWNNIPAYTCSTQIGLDMARFLGYYMGDGSYRRDAKGSTTVDFACCALDEDVANEISGLCVSLVGHEPTRRLTGSKKGCINLRSNDKEWFPLLYRLGALRRAGAKGDPERWMRKVCVPPAILRSPHEVVREFLSALFESDGCAYKYQSAVTLFSKYENFLRDVQTLLLAFGIESSIRCADKIHPDGHKYTGRVLWLSAPDSVKFCEEIGFRSARKRGIAEHLLSRRRRSRRRPVGIDYVAAIEDAGIHRVYDLTIDGPLHAFGANGILVHNCTFEEAWSVGEGAFFEEWNEDVHVLKNWRPPKEWKRVRAYDPGFSSYACMKWYALSPDGWAVCYREYYPHRVTDKEQAAEIKRLSKHDDGTPEEIEYTVADTDAWTPSRDSGQSTAEVFALEGIPLRQATKDLENGWRRLHEWLKPYKGPDEGMMAHLRFTKDCLNTIRTYPACEQSKTNPEDISKDSEHHCQDVDRYFTMSRPRPFEERVLKFPDSMTEEQKKQAIKNMEFEQWYQKMKERR